MFVHHLKIAFREFSGGPAVLGLCAFISEGTGSIPSQGTKIPQAVRQGQKEKKLPPLINHSRKNKDFSHKAFS